MSKKRIEKKKPTCEANGFRLIGWRCPECGCVNAAERSLSHVGKCRQCSALIDVKISPLITETAARSLETVGTG